MWEDQKRRRMMNSYKFENHKQLLKEMMEALGMERSAAESMLWWASRAGAAARDGRPTPLPPGW